MRITSNRTFRPGRRRCGAGLAVTLVVVGLVAMLACVIASASVGHLQVSTRATNEAFAYDAARSVVSLALARIYKAPDFGTVDGSDRTLTFSLPLAPEGNEAMLTFDPAQAAKLEIPLSVNNLMGKGSVATPQGKVVPTQAVRLVAVGRCLGVSRRIEVVLHQPPFPFAACCDGAIVSSGGLQVASREMDTPPDTPVQKMKPAEVMCNASASDAIRLGPETVINGDLRAVGGIRVDPSGGTTVMGQVLEGQGRRRVDPIDISKYDPGSDATSLSPSYASPRFTGKLRSKGDVSIEGDTTLDGAVMYVEGDLTINGALRGSGIIVTTGKLTIVGQADMDGADKVAVVSKGDVRIEGRGQSTSKLRGVVYTEGSLVASRLRLEGTLLSRTDASSQVRLDQVSLIRDLTASRVEVTASSGSAPPPPIKLQPKYRDINVGQDGELFYDKRPSGKAVLSGQQWYHYHHIGVSVRNGQPNVTMCTDAVKYNGQQVLRYKGGRQFTVDELRNGGPNVDVILNHLNNKLAQSTDTTVYDLAWLQRAFGLDPAALGTGGTTTGGGTTGGGATSVFTLDPSELLPFVDRTRIVLWQEQ